MENEVLGAIIQLLGSTPVVLVLVWRMMVIDKRYDKIIDKQEDL